MPPRSVSDDSLYAHRLGRLLGTASADIERIYRAQVEAGEKDDSTAESSDVELSSEPEDCIIVASRRC
ncbi:uncharacterized protein B0I36DRAFT_336574 [Microdochium trichocladiopsis]|uniref:Uncharacterized protein n=1 Tax=Microdochium trichocladiopsis TaxID=1682393 RepID=A0A9P8XT81_9PEZI|nr:uncharacterized protein B0I36DRAFT_342562 [Microdochium trichocladiopsis]XP_046004906.1 uncharacterized protein B0I36DRAFT_339968 [Microdochium trichocladiopsis]XP_046005693.1 uncharacterized protein B0I36DRAFT_336574 [Microdochium trichocladiopsis]KAH7009212.1 hypothetical protein B0I36DRAFT_342562 [Microdochium trichocladiopsis]KAH7012641.1 hypothetical protein B0I36DRAFT_339968 [Microdochium trichocladiopsis]KAH7016069.1 hypothetical protein B0I36DRAFT_336574 [Microdochium trichocladiops